MVDLAENYNSWEATDVMSQHLVASYNEGHIRVGVVGNGGVEEEDSWVHQSLFERTVGSMKHTHGAFLAACLRWHILIAFLNQHCGKFGLRFVG